MISPPFATPPRVLILRAPGTNCDLETEYAFQKAGASAERIHINRLLDRPAMVRDFQILCLPGGFSYGDDIAAGRILATQISRYLFDMIAGFREAGKLVMGICNGFQVLIKSGLLLSSPQGPLATLTWNDSGKFEDRWVSLRIDSTRSPFLIGLTELYLPVAHAEGKFVARDSATLDHLQARGQLAMRYTSDQGGDAVEYPHNPNGSQRAVAGICDETGRLFGLMPHPERHIDPTHHPRWTREPAREHGEGFAIFQNAVRYFR